VIRRVLHCIALMSQTVGRARVAWLIGAQVGAAVLEGVGLILLVPVIQAVGGADSLRVPAFGAHLPVVATFAAVVGVVVLRAFGLWRSAVLAADIQLATVDRLRLGLLDDLYVADWAYLSGKRRSHIVQQLTTDVERAHVAFASMIQLIVGVLVLGVTSAVAIVLSPVVGGLALVGLLLVAFLASRSTRSATELGRETTKRLVGFGAVLTDSLASVRVMRAHDAAGAWSELVGHEAARVREIRRAYIQRAAGVVAALAIVATVAVLAMIGIGRAIGLGLPEIAALAVVSSRLLGSAQQLLTSAQLFANDSPSILRLEEFHAEVLEHPERLREVADVTGSAASTVEPGAGKRRAPALLALRGISVSYDEDDAPGSRVLIDVDLELPRLGLATVTGPSGSGKSTLLDVVLGLRRPQGGEVYVDGEPLVDLAAWRARVGYVPQQTVLVPGTVWQNLAWSLQPGRTLTEEQAWTALRVACLDEVVAALPDGLQAALQEVAELSGGEQQRLSIARALVRDPELLVLDEATSALDRDTEARLLAGLLDGTRAVLMVTHRNLVGQESTVLRLENGRAVED
jgi:ATP-binding cassette subfamily C protein